MRSTIRVDHLATWNEVWEALAFSSLHAFELRRAGDAGDESGPDFGAAVGILAEDLAWLAFASKVPDGRLN
ncbi:MAG: hypothetical protein WCE50_15745 [Candidatus Acidiferrum sp.]